MPRCLGCRERQISNSNLICVFIHFKQACYLGDNIEITFLLRSFYQRNTKIICTSQDWILAKVLSWPLSHISKEPDFMFFKRKVLVRMGIWQGSIFLRFIRFCCFFLRKKSPRTIVVDVGIELSLIVVNSKSSSVNSNDIANLADDGKIFKSLSIQY